MVPEGQGYRMAELVGVLQVVIDSVQATPVVKRLSLNLDFILFHRF